MEKISRGDGLLLVRAAALLVVALLVGCSDATQPAKDAGVDAVGDAMGDGGLYPNQPSGNPLVPEIAALPFPSDFYLVEDKTTVTGRRVEIPAEALPAKLPPQAIAGADGYSRVSPIVAFLPGAIDPATLPPYGDPGVTTTKASSVLLIEEGSFKLVPILAENDMAAPKDWMRALLIRPLLTLEPNKGYVVVLTNKLKRLDNGETHVANPAMRALLDNQPTGVPAIESQRKAFELVTQALEKVGIAKSDVVLAWSFHTRSEEQVVQPLLKMQDQTMKAPLPSYTITSDTVDADLNRQVVATFDGPNFVSPTNNLIELDAQGEPKQFGTRTVEFSLTIPDSIKEPRPVILYGHGFLGSWHEGTRGSYNKLCRENRFSSAGSFFGFNEEIKIKAITTITTNLGEIATVNADVLQTFVNYTMLGRLIREKLAAEITKDLGGGQTTPVFDATKVYYLGISNGGTFGYVAAATLPKLERAVIVVGGGGLIHFLQRSVVWNGYQPFYHLLFPNPIELQLALSALQTGFDPIDSMNYVSHLVDNRFPGREPLRAQIHQAINDSQVHNLVSEWVYRTAKVPVITPSPKDIWGVDTITAPAPGGAPAGTKGAVFVYDEKVAPSPETNVPPATDNRTHQTVRDLTVYQKHVAEFLETGRFVQVCSDACDPD